MNWKKYVEDESQIRKLSDSDLDKLIRKSLYETEMREKYLVTEHRFRNYEYRIRNMLMQIDGESLKMEEKITNLMMTFHRNQNYEVDFFTFGTFVNDSMKQLCQNIIRLTNTASNEFEKDDLIYIAELFSGGSNICERRIKFLSPFYDSLYESASKKVKNLNRETLKQRESPFSENNQSVDSITAEIKTLESDIAKLRDITNELSAKQSQLNSLKNEKEELENWFRQHYNNPIVVHSQKRTETSEENCEFTDEHFAELNEMHERIKNLKDESAKLELSYANAQKNMERAANENDESLFEERKQRIIGMMGPLKDKYYKMKNAYVSIDTLRSMVDEFNAGRFDYVKNDENNNSPEIQDLLLTLENFKKEHNEVEAETARLKAIIASLEPQNDIL